MSQTQQKAESRSAKRLNKRQWDSLVTRITSDQDREVVKEAAKALPEKEAQYLLALIRGSESGAVQAANISTNLFGTSF
ncbi:MAG: hypothetical protein KGH57_02610 [Candidatus Micrarchaeota archaeon]|nr:hypothetical protein [Candidatus Micrarchaeota archaeon]